jgi:Arc/MetJ-type ribon-helix-helix transcriptional regulator
MSKEIAVPLPDALVDFMDDLVARGEEESRATIVLRALKRERRRLGILRDIEILEHLGPDPDMDAFLTYTARQPIDLG